jgi:hypothetical protein
VIADRYTGSGFLRSVDKKMMDFFPEFAGEIVDPRKNQITIRHLLQMRAAGADLKTFGEANLFTPIMGGSD